MIMNTSALSMISITKERRFHIRLTLGDIFVTLLNNRCAARMFPFKLHDKSVIIEQSTFI